MSAPAPLIAGGATWPSAAQTRSLLAQGRLGVRMGPLSVRIRCRLPDVAAFVHRAYAHHPVFVDPPFSDLHVEVRTPGNLRRWLRPQVEFCVNGDTPFEPLPRRQAAALLEWGLNWTIAASCHQWLMFHAASLERNGRVVVLPAPPGSGKSTLCAALALRGWRLLSDEITLVDPVTLECAAMARPINLKNASIDLIRRFAPDAQWGPLTLDTSKGVVTHLIAPARSVERMGERAPARWIVTPRFVPGAEPLLTPVDRASAFARLIENAFNYSVLGEAGFEATWNLVQACTCHEFSYSRLDDALEVFDWLSSLPED